MNICYTLTRIKPIISFVISTASPTRRHNRRPTRRPNRPATRRPNRPTTKPTISTTTATTRSPTRPIKPAPKGWYWATHTPTKNPTAK